MQLNTKALTEVDVSYPVIADCTIHVRLKGEIKLNKEKTGNYLLLTCEALDPVYKRDTEEELNKAFTVRNVISLVEKNGYDPNESLKRLALALQLDDADNLHLDDVQEQVVKAVITYKPAEGQYREGNEVKAFLPKDDDFVDSI